MREYYCYVYYDESWNAYYVGKGRRNRRRATRKLEVPPNNRIQIFYFSEEWEAYECEIELINFWKRRQDGGTLANLALGGPGCPGVIPSDETKAKRSKALKGRTITPEWRRKLSAAAKGRACPQVTKDAASRTHKGKPKSPEHRAKIAAALKGNTNGAKNK